jgi:hypothetical protein
MPQNKKLMQYLPPNPGLEFVREMIDMPAIQLSNLIPNGRLDKSKARQKFDVTQNGEMGIYVFWWHGEKDLPARTSIVLKGPKRDNEAEDLLPLFWDLEDFPLECQKQQRFPLYIGKTTKFVNRLSMHLAMSTHPWKAVNLEDWVPDDMRKRMLYKPTTSCQFRSGFEHLFGNPNKDRLYLLFERVFVSFFPIPLVSAQDRSDVKQRFYLEDLAIGFYRPWFNVDSER